MEEVEKGVLGVEEGLAAVLQGVEGRMAGEERSRGEWEEKVRGLEGRLGEAGREAEETAMEVMVAEEKGPAAREEEEVAEAEQEVEETEAAEWEEVAKGEVETVGAETEAAEWEGAGWVVAAKGREVLEEGSQEEEK